MAGGPQWDGSRCSKCRDDLVPWADLSEPVKEVNRRGVSRFFRELGITPEAAARMEPGAVGKAVEALRRTRPRSGYGNTIPAIIRGIDDALRELGEEVPRG